VSEMRGLSPAFKKSRGDGRDAKRRACSRCPGLSHEHPLMITCDCSVIESSLRQPPKAPVLGISDRGNGHRRYALKLAHFLFSINRELLI